MASTVKKPNEVKELEKKTNHHFTYNRLSNFLYDEFGFEEAVAFSMSRWSSGRWWNLSDDSEGEKEYDDLNWNNLYFNPDSAHTTKFYFTNMYPLFYIDKNLNCWETSIKEKENGDLYFKPWRRCTRLKQGNFIQNVDEILTLIEEKNPYLYKFYKEKYNCNIRSLILAPQLELLVKANYNFAKQDFLWVYNIKLLDKHQKELDCFNRLCQPGKNPKEIFKTSKNVYSLLKDEDDLEKWDIYRKFDKMRKMDKDTLSLCYNSNINEQDLNSIYTILGKEYDGKKIFTFNSLVNYLNRIDMYEAIGRYEGLQLIKDYLQCCNELDMKPRIDGDSLKREHDIAARNVRNKRNEELAEKMKHIKVTAHDFDYAEKVFYVKAITDYDELIDEAKQQHNCVASYAKNIAEGKTRIWVARECAHPEKSLATLEPKSNFAGYRQKLLAYNQPIKNKALTEFLDRAIKHAKDVEAGNKEPMKIEVVDGRMQEVVEEKQEGELEGDPKITSRQEVGKGDEVVGRDGARNSDAVRAGDAAVVDASCERIGEHASDGRVNSEKANELGVVEQNKGDQQFSNVAVWYCERFPEDSLGERLTCGVSFDDVYDAVCSGKDIYELLGVDDSVVRGRIFEEVAQRRGVDYEEISYAWVSHAINGSDIATGDNEPKVVIEKPADEVEVEVLPPKVEEVVPDRDTEGFGVEGEPHVQMEIFDFDTRVEDVEIINEPVCEAVVPTNVEVQNCLHGCIAYGENEDPEKIQAILKELEGRTYNPMDMREVGQELAAKYGCEFNGCSIDDGAREAVFEMLDRGETFNTKIDFATLVVNNGFRVEDNREHLLDENKAETDRNGVVAEASERESVLVGDEAR